MTSGSTDYDDFFNKTAPPEKFEEKICIINSFVQYYKASDQKLVLVTSGGTTVPLESRTVRFIDNFSIGTRGSASAEYFLDHGYAVIFLHRQRSLLPFHRHLQHNMLDCLALQSPETNSHIYVNQESTVKLLPILQRYSECQKNRRLCLVSFTSLGDYLHLLRVACQSLRPLCSRAMLYLAAAVSDFYIPSDQMPEHKIQSQGEKPLHLSLELVPKMLKPLVKDWVPDAYVISFKLETDKSILIGKAKKALEQYEHKLVVANVLDTRKKEVILVTKDKEELLALSDEEEHRGMEIEEKLTRKIADLHLDFYSNSAIETKTSH
ncbi:hypothetical protein C0Q70_02922 [Pomacea canaliculata]|uniref:DNA/pantothenate metabolism flavoprotein C-terminal domain-containing protein n=1 Tax=Pomacea canaliculata TaxID=400727 RepID=A0A2T7PRA0_POMCA|nr:phosphopantothenate--cysteine ligase-like [Pomacea canaliculata]PVD35953.1 hypothetical protein C0Q70_02922 [Pomacea canaliculata]